jgi:hypothetical protein
VEVVVYGLSRSYFADFAANVEYSGFSDSYLPVQVPLHRQSNEITPRESVNHEKPIKIMRITPRKSAPSAKNQRTVRAD